jgi:hypothetical protein
LWEDEGEDLVSKKVMPIGEVERRLPEHGRIRIGEKKMSAKGKPYPTKIDTFRFTSADREALGEIAALYGGTVTTWDGQPGQHQVKTAAKEISVVLPPDPLGGTPIYEMWSGGGCVRRCDGEICLLPTNTASGAEMVETPCICAQKEALECTPKTRLSVILPDIRFGGAWRLESGGWNVAHEMPGMVDMIRTLQDRGLSRALLALEERESKFAGKTRQFVVPVLRPAMSVDRMLSGEGRLQALAPASQAPTPPALDAGEPNAEPQPQPAVDTAWEDDQVIDAEIVEEPASPSPGPTTGSSTSDDEIRVDKKRKKMHAMLREVGMGVTERHALVKRITNGSSGSSADLSETGLDVMLAALDAIKKAEAFYEGEDDQGMAIVVRR